MTLWNRAKNLSGKVWTVDIETISWQSLKKSTLIWHRSLAIPKIFLPERETTTGLLAKVHEVSQNCGITAANFPQTYLENTTSCGSILKSKVADLPAQLVAELFAVRKPSSPEYFVTQINDLRYICFSTWIDEIYEQSKKRHHQLIYFSIIITTRDKHKNIDHLKFSLIRFGKLLKFLQNTTGLLRDEFLAAFDKNAEISAMKPDPGESSESFHKKVNVILLS